MVVPDAVPARLCLRSGFGCLSRIARAMGFDVPMEASPEAGITLTYQEFLDAGGSTPTWIDDLSIIAALC